MEDEQEATTSRSDLVPTLLTNNRMCSGASLNCLRQEDPESNRQENSDNDEEANSKTQGLVGAVGVLVLSTFELFHGVFHDDFSAFDFLLGLVQHFAISYNDFSHFLEHLVHLLKLGFQSGYF